MTLPGEHVWHFDVPCCPVYFPAEQLLHATVDFVENFPFVQAVQRLDPVVSNLFVVLPFGHVLQLVIPKFGAYRPDAQSAQAIVDLLENLPATHSVQRLAPPLLPVSVIEPWGQTSQIDRPFVLANEPAGHALHSGIPSFPA